MQDHGECGATICDKFQKASQASLGQATIWRVARRRLRRARGWRCGRPHLQGHCGARTRVMDLDARIRHHENRMPTTRSPDSTNIKILHISSPSCIAFRQHRTQYRVAFTPNPKARIKGFNYLHYMENMG